MLGESPDSPTGPSSDQAESVKKTADYVAQLRRVGKGLGVFQWDKELAA